MPKRKIEKYNQLDDAVDAFRKFMAARTALGSIKVVAANAESALATATQKYQEAEARLLDLTGLTLLDPCEDDGNGETPGWKRAPEGDNLKALRVIDKADGIDYVDRGELAKLLYGRDVRAFRQRLYNRTRHWKDLGWLVQDNEGDWVVAPGLLDD